jgi:septum formation topological specificity factor MinE
MNERKRESRECSVVVAFAELDRLERDRADFAAAKQAVSASLTRQRLELYLLRERFEAERPRALARARRERLRVARIHEQARARAQAEAELAHLERLSQLRVNLEAKRLRLAALEADAEERVEPIGRRMVQWSVPVAATALVAFLGLAIFDDEATAQTIDAVEQLDEVVEVEVEVEVEPEPEPEVEVEPEPEPEPEPQVEAKKQPAPAKAAPRRPAPTKAAPKQVTPPPPTKKHSNPLRIEFGGNPLG